MEEQIINDLINFYEYQKETALEEVKYWESKIQDSKGIERLSDSRPSWLRSKTIALTRYECYRDFISKLKGE